MTVRGEDRASPSPACPHFRTHEFRLPAHCYVRKLRTHLYRSADTPWVGSGAQPYAAGVTRAGLDKDPYVVAQMFDGVARRYDLTNTLISAGRDRRWRHLNREALRP